MTKPGKERLKPRQWSVPPGVRVSRGPLVPAPALFAHLAFAQFMLGCLVMAAIYRPFAPGFGLGSPLWIGCCLGMLAFAFLCVLMLRVYIQDWLATLSGPERVLVVAILLAAFFLPGPSPDHDIVPEGFATIMPALMLFSANSLMARRYLFAAMLGFWAGISAHGGIALGWVLGFGALLLWNLAAIHIAFVGSPFGLRGWWPFFRIWRTVVFYFVPAGLAAVLFYSIWPDPPLPAPQESPRTRADARMVLHRLADFDAAQWRDLIVRAMVSVIVILAALIILYYLRRHFAKRLRPQALPTVLGADIGEIEYSAVGPREAKPTLEGNRGRILRLWRRWERAVQPDPAGRDSGETAAEYAARIKSASATEARSAIARMLESAHYAQSEPTDTEVRDMEALVEADLRDKP